VLDNNLSLCDFVAALFIVDVFLSLIISSSEPVMEPQSEKIERELSNDGSWGHLPAFSFIYHQD
jgi:hypothetical protein